MFKKKVKKDQGVLNLQNNGQPQHPDGDNPNPSSNPPLPPSVSSPHPHPHHSKSGKADEQRPETEPNHGGEECREEGEAAGSRRGKNLEESYREDAGLNLQNEPKKRVKEGGGGGKWKPVLGSNTYGRSQSVGEAVHSSFEERNFKAGKSLIKDLGLGAEELEEELAKRRFLENVEATRLVKEGKVNTRLYRGLNGYANHRLTSDEIEKAEESYKKKMGPSRLNSSIKNSCRFDYVQDLCKDWHDSGYCPFGNSCLYLHDRSTLKTGWELEKDFEAAERERWRRISNPQLAQKEEQEKLLRTIEKYKPQESCSYCERPFEKPVEVECGHFFCTPCALKLLKCKDCGKRLSGIMNEAWEKLEKQKRDYAEMVAKLESGEEHTKTHRRKFQNTDSIDVFAD